MRKKKPSRDILTLSILTLITVLTWIAYDVYKALTEYTIPQVLEKQMEPLAPQLDRERIEKLKERLRISEEELEKIPAAEISPETASPAEGPESTASATSSGEL